MDLIILEVGPARFPIPHFIVSHCSIGRILDQDAATSEYNTEKRAEARQKGNDERSKGYVGSREGQHALPDKKEL